MRGHTAQKTSGSNAGFTLIEIIAVLVLLGILAAVAVPRFLSLHDQARISSLEQLVAAAQTHLSLEYSRQLLSRDGSPSLAWDSIPANICDGVSLDGWLRDASLTCTNETTHYSIRAAHPNSSADATGRLSRPDS